MSNRDAFRPVTCMFVVLLAILACVAAVGADELTECFDHPPDAARPHTYWHWMNGNVTKEGVTADLEAMQRAGIGGVVLFNIEGKLTESMPVYIDRPVRSLTPPWFAMLHHAAAECKRLGLEMAMMNCSGWTMSGGPWVPPEKSMMRIAWSEKYLKGPGRLSSPLPRPPCDFANYQNLTHDRTREVHKSVAPKRRFYRDVAVVAYRLDPLAARAAALWPPKLTCSNAGENPAKAVDGDGDTAVSIDAMGFLHFQFGEPVVVRGIEYVGSPCELQALAADGTNWRKVVDLPGPRPLGYPQVMPVPETKASQFRLFLRDGGKVTDIKLSGDSLVQDYAPKASFHGFWEDAKTAEDRLGRPTPAWAVASIRSKDVVNLTDRTDANGALDWDAPKGDWMIVRLGCAPIGTLNGPCGREYAGLECDKLDSEATELHFNHYAGRVADALKDLIGTGFHAVHVDSWEAGDQNCTPRFVDEFRRRRGYDPVPFLLVHGGGRVVDSPAVADRFLWDVRRTIADLLADNHFGKLNALCHRRGLKFQGEVAGVMVETTIDQLQSKRQCDLVMGEFQMPNWLYGDHWARWDAREAATAAHLYGQPIAAAEAFTSFDRWIGDPYGLKGIGDLAFTMGVNRLVFHTWACNPSSDRFPGMTMGPFGINFSRLNTWWGRPAKTYIDYLRRCQAMLQHGRFVADILYFYGEGTPNTLPSKSLIEPALPDGYSYDGCDADTLRDRVAVKDGRLTLRNGMSYRVLVLKDDRRMTPETLAKLKDLVEAGATLIGPKPLESPSLRDYPQCDRQVRALADALWGNVDGKNTIERSLGAGRVVWGPSVGDVLKSLNLGPDVAMLRNERGSSTEWIHRRAGEADIYFVANQQNITEHGSALEIWDQRYDAFATNELAKDAARLDVAFRVTGKRPELWDAVSGTRRDLPEFRQEGDRTIVPLWLPPSGSCFVVFRRNVADQAKAASGENFPQLRHVQKITGPWTVAFNPRWGGPAQATFDRLDDWTQRTEPGIKFYSGRATYKRTFDAEPSLCKAGKRVFLDLGKLRSLAEVRLNGKDLGVLWCPPWKVEVTGLLKPQQNTLEIDIINVWANRIIGDAGLPKEKRLTWTSLSDTNWALKPNHRLIPSGLYGPVALTVEEPRTIASGP
jgi:hypothetical protein